MGAGRARNRVKAPLTERRVVVGPILRDLVGLGWSGDSAVLATAFYSARALQALPVSAERLQVLCRLDTDDPQEWAKGVVDPSALLDQLRSFEKSGTRVDLRIHKFAHAKVFAGADGVMIGSANLTLQGFGGGWEMVQTSRSPDDIRIVRTSLRVYARTLDAFSLDQLEAYVARHKDFVRKIRKKHRGFQHRDKVMAPATRPPRLGAYADFLKWANRQPGDAAAEICARAHGKGNLQGHINRNFYGLRQFLLAFPEMLEHFRKESPDTYKLSTDSQTEQAIAKFVKENASDEDQFSLDIWKTYLPKECGGRADRHGGTIGNLNRMLPLVASYLAKKTRP